MKTDQQRIEEMLEAGFTEQEIKEWLFDEQIEGTLAYQLRVARETGDDYIGFRN